MENWTWQEIVAVVTVLSNLGILGAAYKLIGHMAVLNFKVDVMWKEFEATIGPVMHRKEFRTQVTERMRMQGRTKRKDDTPEQ